MLLKGFCMYNVHEENEQATSFLHAVIIYRPLTKPSQVNRYTRTNISLYTAQISKPIFRYRSKLNWWNQIHALRFTVFAVFGLNSQKKLLCESEERNIHFAQGKIDFRLPAKGNKFLVRALTLKIPKLHGEMLANSACSKQINAFLPVSFVSALLTCSNGPINKNKTPLANTFISIICFTKEQATFLNPPYFFERQQPIRTKKILGKH